MLYYFVIGISVLATSCTRSAVINTDDGQIDPHWPGTSFVTDPRDDVTLDLPSIDRGSSRRGDILQAWGILSDSRDLLYLRLQTQEQGDLTVGVQLDCDRNGSFGDASDLYARYDSTVDELEVGRGDRRILVANRPSEWGERVGADFEWGLGRQFGLEELNWDQCLSGADVRFYTFGQASRIDETAISAWSPSGTSP